MPNLSIKRHITTSCLLTYIFYYLLLKIIYNTVFNPICFSKKTMPTSFYSKLFLILVACVMSPSNWMICMEPGQNVPYFQWTLKYKPQRQPEDSELTKKRNQCISMLSDNPQHIKSLFPDIVLTKERFSNWRGVCYTTAMKGTLGLPEEKFKELEKSIIGCQDWVHIIGMPYKYFDQKKNPQPGYLATYAPHDNTLDICHFGVVTPEGRIRSRMGTVSFILIHDTWHLPDDMGNEVCYWKPKKKYRTDKELLFKDLMAACSSQEMNQMIETRRKNFFLIAKGYIAQEEDDPFDLAYHSLKTVVGIDINARNNDNETVLMIAARRGDIDLVNLYIAHGAEISLKNNQGETAIDIAKKRGHNKVVNYLSKIEFLLEVWNNYRPISANH